MPTWKTSTIATLCCACLFALAVPAQQAQQQSQKTPEVSQEPFVIEQYHTKLWFENDGTGGRELQVRIRVQSEAGVQQLGQLIFGYNAANEKMEVASVEVSKPGTTVFNPAGAVQDRTGAVARQAPIYTDYHEKHVTVAGLQPGGMLSYRILTRVHTPLAPGNFWLEYNFLRDVIVLDERLEVSVPRGRAIKLKTRPDATPEIPEEGERRIYRWKSSHPQRETQEESKVRKTRKEEERPAVQLTTFQSWADVGRWYAPLQRERATPTPAIRAKAEELVRGTAAPAEKLHALYDFVAKNFRYVSLSFGLGRYQPHAAEEVLANQYGDCKDKHTLLESLVEAIGLHAYPALISSSHKIDPEVPSPAQFDHVITAIPPGQLGKEWIWLDTTTEVAPFRMLAANLRDKQALVVPLDPGAESAPLVETPADPPFPVTQRLEVEGQVSELGKLTVRVRYLLRGDSELLLRSAFRRTPQNQWKQLASLLALSDGFRGAATDVTVSDPAATQEPFRVEYQLTLPNYLDWTRKDAQIELPLPVVGLPQAPEATEPGESPGEPIEFGTPLDIVERMQLELPANYTLRAPVPVAVARDYAEYRSSYKVEGNKVTAERTLRFRMRELPAERARDYAAFMRAVRSDEDQKMALESAAAGKPSIPATAKTEELYQAAQAALENGNFQVAIELYKRVVELEPKYQSAWNNLGRAYLTLQQIPPAIEAFRKQIEVNPYDQYAYNNLGRALWFEQKYDEAAAAFRKQIEISPLDRWAHANLGMLYREQRKYDEAIAELEKAVTITPEDPNLHVGLGDAYLNRNQNDKALAAFDKAIELAPVAPVWNNVAYQLALKNVHLERAQQYAESAVAATAAELRNASLARLTPVDLGRVSSLAAFWDTLGWVHFQKGDLAAAEKYVHASWLLGQHGEVGDHLAQIYEKQGQKAEAIRTYAQALAATRPVPETRGRLARMLGGEDKINSMVLKAGEELSEMRTARLGKRLAENASAEFFVLLSLGTQSPLGAEPKVEDVKFISGSEKLRPLAEALRSAAYPGTFPDQTPTKLVRRGILSCSAASGQCVFVMFLPDQARSVN